MTRARALPAALDKPHAAAFHDGPGHIVRYANPAFEAEFGAACVGMPAREAMASLPPPAFALMDRVLREGRPLAMRIEVDRRERRLVVVPRFAPEEATPYGVTTHLVPPGWRARDAAADRRAPRG